MTTFAYPFLGEYPITSPFGPRDGGMHTGVDFGLPSSTPVLAAADGRIIYEAHEPDAGMTITIQHADGLQSRYHHLATFFYSTGDFVRAGTVIALSDNTGDSTGPHLHFEIRTDPATPVDPVPYLTADTPPDGVTFGDGDSMFIIRTSDGKREVVAGGKRLHYRSLDKLPADWFLELDDDEWTFTEQAFPAA